RIAVFSGSAKSIKECAVNYDGHIAVALDEGGDMMIWNCSTMGRIPITPHSAIKAFALGSSGRILVTVHCDNSLGIWSVADGMLRRTILTDGTVSICRLSKDEEKILAVGKTRSTVWNAETGEMIGSIDATIDEISTDVRVDDDLSMASINGV